MRMVVVGLVVIGVQVAAASPLVCPRDTRARVTNGDGLTQEWCERADGVRHGEYRSFNGKAPSTAGQYVDGKMHGQWTSWRATGGVFEQKQWRNGVEDGEWVTYYNNGGVELRDAFRLGKREGTWTWWYANGKQKAVTTYAGGKEEGRAVEWREDGSIETEGSYEGGARVGAWHEYGARGAYCGGKRCGAWELADERGQIAATGGYRDDRRDGAWKLYAAGKVIARGAYAVGQKTGTWTYWDLDTGKKTRELVCRAGVPDGPRRDWWPNGKLALSGRYAAGRLDGAWLQIGESGARLESLYRGGELVRGEPIESTDELGLAADGEGRRAACAPDAILGDSGT